MTTRLDSDVSNKIHRAYKDALGVQDACNMFALAAVFHHSLDAVRSDLWLLQEHQEYKAQLSKVALSSHPVVVLQVSKLHDLARLGLSDCTRFGLAYDLAMKVEMGVLHADTPEYRDALAAYFEHYGRT